MNSGIELFKKIETIFQEIDGLQIYYNPEPEPPSEGRYKKSAGLPLHPQLHTYLETHFPDGLFLHHYEAIACLLQSKNVVITTPTSSGKSLIYAIPAFNEILTEPEATVLLIYPQKALANEQLLTLMTTWSTRIGTKNVVSRVARCDGTAPNEIRQFLGTHIEKVMHDQIFGTPVSPKFAYHFPHQLIPLRGKLPGRYSLTVGDTGVGASDYFHLLREAYPRAIYHHGGKAYRVLIVIQYGHKKVFLRPHHKGHTTIPGVKVSVSRRKPARYREWPFINAVNSMLTISEKLVRVFETDRSGHGLESEVKVGVLKPLSFLTVRSYVQTKPELCEKITDHLNSGELTNILANAISVSSGTTVLTDRANFRPLKQFEFNAENLQTWARDSSGIFMTADHRNQIMDWIKL